MSGRFLKLRLVSFIGIFWGLSLLGLVLLFGVNAFADTSSPCAFQSSVVNTCSSSDPTISVSAHVISDTTGCTFAVHLDWGDGTSKDVTLVGGPPGAAFLANHTYAKSGDYTIDASGYTESGFCSIYGDTYHFTLTGAQKLITSPADGSLVAMTDKTYLSPQPQPNERAPKQRKLTIKGTADCASCTITVNGIQTAVTNNTWQLQLPVTKPGELKLVAATSDGKTDTATIHLVDVQVVNPTENKAVPVTAEPAMPNLAATLQVVGLPNGVSLENSTFTWKLEVINRWATRDANNKDKKIAKTTIWNDDTRTIAQGTTTGVGASWQPDFGDNLIGGWARLTVTTTIPGIDGTVTAEPRWFDMPGANPSRSDIDGYLTANAADQNDVATLDKIVCQESHYQQFATMTEKRNGQQFTNAQSSLIPTDWEPNSGKNRPYFGAPAGIGLMQKDPATFPDEQWDWQQNILAGLQVFAEKKSTALAHPAKVRKNLNELLTKDLKKVNKARAKKKLKLLTEADVDVIDVPDFTPLQLKRETLHLYNGGYEYMFRSTYNISDDGLTVETDMQDKGEWKQVPLRKKEKVDYADLVLNCRP